MNTLQMKLDWTLDGQAMYYFVAYNKAACLRLYSWMKHQLLMDSSFIIKSEKNGKFKEEEKEGDHHQQQQ